MSLTAPERETVIRFDDEGGMAHIYTAQRPVITSLKSNPCATLLGEGVFEGSAWATFSLPKKLVSLRVARGVTRVAVYEQPAGLKRGASA